ncbi:MAG: hypothetical protein AMXMBFR45_21540 [Gammaproteobacteria bacterium]|nr:MAG: hypothetical protein BroJett010_16740 [Gammaproteobacteria bacterium]
MGTLVQERRPGNCTGTIRRAEPRAAPSPAADDPYNVRPAQQDAALPMNPAEIQALIEAQLPGCTASVQSPDNIHYEALIVCAAFAGKRPLQRHQMVYAALGARMGGDIHALSIQALTPEEQAGRKG